jgi:DeoR family fructose operon transcriptional repressor
MYGTPNDRTPAAELFAAERRAQILQHAKDHGRVDAKALSEKFNVTTETVRRDLIQLQNAGLLTRVHGGAVTSDRVIPGIAERALAMSTEKMMIARSAALELPDLGSIIIDAGTTTSMLASLLPLESTLSVITNSLQVANNLLENARAELLILGGRLDRLNSATSESWALDALGRIAADVAFIGTTGLSPSLGLSTQDRREADVKASMIAAANRVVVLADHTKLGVNRMHIFARLSEIDLLITDSGVANEDVDAFRAAGLEVRVVGPGAV